MAAPLTKGGRRCRAKLSDAEFQLRIYHDLSFYSGTPYGTHLDICCPSKMFSHFLVSPFLRGVNERTPLPFGRGEGEHVQNLITPLSTRPQAFATMGAC